MIIKLSVIDRFQIENRAIKTKVSQQAVKAKANIQKTTKNSSKCKQANCFWRGKTFIPRCRLHSCKFCIWLAKSVESFLDQSQSEVKQNQWNPELLSTLS